MQPLYIQNESDLQSAASLDYLMVVVTSSCADQGIFAWGGGGGGVQVHLTEKALVCFSVHNLFTEGSMVYFKDNYTFPRFQRVSSFFQLGGGGGARGLFIFFQGGGGFNFFRGSNCLFPIETHIICDFPGGSRPPVPPHPSGSTHKALVHVSWCINGVIVLWLYGLYCLVIGIISFSWCINYKLIY